MQQTAVIQYFDTLSCDTKTLTKRIGESEQVTPAWILQTLTDYDSKICGVPSAGFIMLSFEVQSPYTYIFIARTVGLGPKASGNFKFPGVVYIYED